MLPDSFERRIHRWTRSAGAALLAALLAAGAAAAQEGAVTGRVSDAASLEPLPGVQVFVVGTEQGTITDAEGRYRITGVPAGRREVRARLLGYRVESRSVDVAAGEAVTADFELSVSAVSLEALVVTATGEQRRREVANAVSTIDASEEVDKSKATTLTDLLQGRSTGVTVQRSSGSVGTASSIKIRGNSSISLDNTPLVYVDGARIDNTNTDTDGTRGFFVGGQEVSRLNDINPEDIQSIEIVKGPAAATLYGTEAAGGVIRITTKRGREGGAARITGRAEFKTNSNGGDFPSITYNPVLDGFDSDNSYELDVIDEGAPGLESPFRTGTGQSLGGTLRGGTEDVGYYLSSEWDEEEGNLPQNAVEKWSGRANFNASPSDELSVDISNGFTSNVTNLPNNDNNSAGYIGVYYLGNPGFLPIMRSDPNGGGAEIQTCPVAVETALADGTPLADATTALCGQFPYRDAFFAGNSWRDIATLLTEQQVERYTGSATLTYRPLDFWTSRFTIGYDEFADDLTIVTPVDPAQPFGSASLGSILRDSRTNRNLTLEASSSVALDLLEDLRSTTTVGGQWFKSSLQATQATGTEFPAGSPTIGNSVSNTGGDFFTETRTLGVFVQQQFAWRDRLFVTPAVRWDDNSAFGEQLGIQAYPRLSGTYNFGPGEGLPGFVSALKLRAAWGESGKQPPTNAASPLLFSAPTSLDGASRLGVFPNRPGNPELQPERGRELEVGFDAGLLDDRVGLEVTYYDQTTENAIVTRQLSPSIGFPGAQFTNVGEIVNSGLEVGVDARALQTRDVRLDLGVNFTTNDNEVTELADPIIFGLGGTTQRHEEGLPFAAYKQRTITIGPDGEAVISDTAEFQGHPTPEWEGSVSATLALFDRVTLYGFMDFAGGFQQFNNALFFQCAFGNCAEFFETDSDGELTDRAKIVRASIASNARSPFFEDADFAKIRSASIRFDVPESWVGVFGARGAAVTVAGENLATFTDYSGADPEINFGGGVNASNAEFFTVPPARRFTASLSLQF